MVSMQLTTQQQQQLSQGQPVELSVDGEECVLLTRQAFERVTGFNDDASPWTPEEFDLLAAADG